MHIYEPAGQNWMVLVKISIKSKIRHIIQHLVIQLCERGT